MFKMPFKLSICLFLAFAYMEMEMGVVVDVLDSYANVSFCNLAQSSWNAHGVLVKQSAVCAHMPTILPVNQSKLLRKDILII